MLHSLKGFCNTWEKSGTRCGWLVLWKKLYLHMPMDNCLEFRSKIYKVSFCSSQRAGNWTEFSLQFLLLKAVPGSSVQHCPYEMKREWGFFLMFSMPPLLPPEQPWEWQDWWEKPVRCLLLHGCFPISTYLDLIYGFKDIEIFLSKYSEMQPRGTGYLMDSHNQ